MGRPEPGARDGADNGRLGHVRPARAGAGILKHLAAARRRAGTALIAGALGVAGCTAAGPPPPSNVALPFDQAISAASDGLVVQARRLAGFRDGAPRAVTVADPVLDATTGQQTAATALVDRRVGDRIADRLAAADLRPFDADSLSRARFLVSGTLTHGLADRPKGALLINLALTDLKTGAVVAQSWALALGSDAIDAKPLPCETDSPVRLRDKALESLVTTAATGAGQPAQAFYLERLAAAARIAEGARLCNDGRPADALGRFQRAATETGGDSPRVLNGLYVTASRLGRTAEADRAFDRLVATGLANRQFEVAFVFKPGSTVLTSDSRYASWLRRIARSSAAARVCLQVVGQAGPTGTPAAAEALALQRAAFIRQRLVGEAAVLGGRTRAIAAAARQNVGVGGTDDAHDALDRRVEFRVAACP